MKVVYISSSFIPSRAANSIHVMKMCQAIAKMGHEVVLLAPAAKQEYEPDVDNVYAYYGVEKCFDIVKLPWFKFSGGSFVYGGLAAVRASLLKPDLIVGRNALGCSIATFLGFQVVFEAHSPIAQYGGVTKWMFERMSHHVVLKKVVVITHSLKEHYIFEYPHLAHKIHVAPDGADPIQSHVVPVSLSGAGKRVQVGYVGHLYRGRGIELLIELARSCLWADFHLVGGSQSDVSRWRSEFQGIENCFFHGFVSPELAERFRTSFDVLLAPYQNIVMAAGDKIDIVKWMSPLKIFEYMATRKPIIASDLPVLREVLRCEYNALLCDPEDVSSWRIALERLAQDSDLADRLGANAYNDLMEKYTWEVRAIGILQE